MSDLQALCDRLGITATSKYGAAKPNPEFKGSHGYKVTLRFAGRQLTVDFYMGAALTEEPTPADVLACLCSDAQGVEFNSFEGWAGEYGYDLDSRKAEKIYRACCQLAPRVRRFLGDSFDAVAQAEH